ncbi:hypothetical protein ACO0LD_26640 [Undibacterium sp. Ji83W]|uniref:hypothetical protein n=1 Tax=Undibacterium sp. Ji83W TaxID=3413043 RepID=UPI003BEFF37E
MLMNIKSQFIKFGTHPFINGVAAVMSVLAGALASFFTSSIRSSLALPGDPTHGNTFAYANLNLTAEALAFWFLVLFAALLFAWSKYADSTTDNEHRNYLNIALKDIVSMPPDAFLQKLGEQYKKSHDEVTRVQAMALAQNGPIYLDEIDKSIRLILTSIAQLANNFDGKANSEYRVYLLLFSVNWNIDKFADVFNIVHLHKDDFIGHLESNPGHCITFSDGNQETIISKQFKDYALPVPYPEHAPSNMLDGAVRAFVDSWYRAESINKFIDHAIPKYANQNHIENIKNFYKNSAMIKGVQSFVSLAIPKNIWSPSLLALAGQSAVGVVMIESNIPGTLNETKNFFLPVALPFLHMLSDLISIRSNATDKSNG